jgi:aldose 1-epimerase
MGFRVTTREATAGDRAGTVYTLTDDAMCQAEVWPFFGFNCLRWQVRTPVGEFGDLLYVAPDWEQNPVPTRSGHPILFPFPNRMEGGRFAFRGKMYQLPLNESSGKHAIHGFTPRNPWHVVAVESGGTEARLTGKFRLPEDHPPTAELWPGPVNLSVSYVLTSAALRVEAEIANSGPTAVPAGLGYHPYFCLPTAPGAVADDLVLTSSAATLWSAEDGIPTGERVPVPPELDFRTPKPIDGLVLDRLFTDLSLDRARAGEPVEVARLAHRSASGRISVSVSPAFRELLLFTPPHRRAVAIEPYTCASNAANLEARGIDSGWTILPPGGRWRLVVEYRWISTV